LKLHGAWFDISNGELEIFDEDNGTFIPAPDL
ncbi:MAG: carbonic anhydrase, partial [Cohaesibacteraceae bacterium]|nr:carbonic anhydrase [Cohaesibacteraceae bacterium]